MPQARRSRFLDRFLAGVATCRVYPGQGTGQTAPLGLHGPAFPRCVCSVHLLPTEYTRLSNSPWMSPWGRTHGIIRCGVHSALVPMKYRDARKHLAAPAFALCKISEFGAVVNGNGFEHLVEEVSLFHFEHLYGSHDHLAGLSRKQESYVVFRFLFQKGERHGFFPACFPTAVSPTRCPSSVC